MKYVTPGMGDYLGEYTIRYSWFLIAVLGYFSRNRFDGIMIGVTIWTPWVIHPLMHPEYYRGFSGGMESPGITFILALLFTLLGAIFGAVFGFIGSKRRNNKSVGGNL